MASNDSRTDFPDEVPVADAVEQIRPAAGTVDDTEPLDGRDSAPLETDESDWHEQHEEVGTFDEDEFR